MCKGWEEILRDLKTVYESYNIYVSRDLQQFSEFVLQGSSMKIGANVSFSHW